jgi:hypothetical protein
LRPPQSLPQLKQPPFEYLGCRRFHLVSAQGLPRCFEGMAFGI